MTTRTLTAFLFFSIFISSAHAQIPAPLKNKSVSLQKSSVYAAWADSGKAIESYQADVPLNPASNTKLVTSFCTLKKLGPTARLATPFYSEGPVQSGKIQNLWVQGSGDPSMVQENLASMVEDLKRLGIKTIEGSVIVDDSFFNSPDYPGRQGNARAYNAPTSAIPLNYNSLSVTISQDRKGTEVSLKPDIPYFKIENRLKAGGRRAVVNVEMIQNGASETVRVVGRVPSRFSPFTLYRSIERPAHFFANTLTAFLRDAGIRVTGESKQGKVPAGMTLLYEGVSPAITDVVTNMNKFSNNFIAEQLTKLLGGMTYGAPATTEKGIKVLEECLADIGIDTQPLFLENGSGLTYKNRMSAKDLVKILMAAYKDQKLREPFMHSLAVYGVDGTMKSRRSRALEQGSVLAKTGTLNNISSFAGFAPAKNGKWVAFSIILNDFRWANKGPHDIQDEIVARYTQLKDQLASTNNYEKE